MRRLVLVMSRWIGAQGGRGRVSSFCPRCFASLLHGRDGIHSEHVLVYIVFVVMGIEKTNSAPCCISHCLPFAYQHVYRLHSFRLHGRYRLHSGSRSRSHRHG